MLKTRTFPGRREWGSASGLLAVITPASSVNGRSASIPEFWKGFITGLWDLHAMSHFFFFFFSLFSYKPPFAYKGLHRSMHAEGQANEWKSIKMLIQVMLPICRHVYFYLPIFFFFNSFVCVCLYACLNVWIVYALQTCTYNCTIYIHENWQNTYQHIHTQNHTTILRRSIALSSYPCYISHISWIFSTEMTSGVQLGGVNTPCLPRLCSLLWAVCCSQGRG